MSQATSREVDMDAIYARVMETVKEANALVLIALNRASEAELKRREKRLDTTEDAKIRSGRELRLVRERVRDLED